MEARSKILTYTLLFTLSLAGCGGGSGGGGGASTCVESAVAIPTIWPSDVEVPSSTRQRPNEAHTNHLILKPTDSRLVPFQGFTPDQIRTAYGIPDNGGSGTIVIVEAHHNPTALEDFNAFSAAFGLPQETSTDVTDSDNQHLQIIYQTGSQPSYDAGWSQESALDSQWAHAMAPNAKIVIIETPSGNLASLMAACDLAATVPNATHSSNSWSSAMAGSTPANEAHFIHPGIVYFFSSGDSASVLEYPAASPNVVAVGGTRLTLDGTDNRLTETAWNGTGCGRSACESRPGFQDAIQSIVGTSRGVVDVSAVGDPQRGVRVRWQGSWIVVGGTSAACPIIAGIANTAGSNRSSSQDQNTQIYSKLGTSSFFDVTTGSSGSFDAGAGWDFPTGVGSPNGTSGF